MYTRIHVHVPLLRRYVVTGYRDLFCYATPMRRGRLVMPCDGKPYHLISSPHALSCHVMTLHFMSSMCMHTHSYLPLYCYTALGTALSPHARHYILYVVHDQLSHTRAHITHARTPLRDTI